MVRSYKRKTERGNQYTSEALQTAVIQVKAGKMKAYSAAKIHKIPLNTLLDHIRGRRGLKSKTQGRSTALSESDEDTIIMGLIEMERFGFALSRNEILSLVGEYVKSNNIKTPFKDSVPNFDWLYSFMKRHNLTLKKTQNIGNATENSVDTFVIHSYFEKLKEIIQHLGLEDKPQQVFNVDEISFTRDPTKTNVISGNDLPSPLPTSSSQLDNISALLMVSANGDKVPPLIIFKGKSVLNEWQAPPEETCPGLAYAATPNGWVDSAVFERYFETIFLTFLGDARPALVVCDGHTTHVSLNLIRTARRENVTILILPSHTSHILQPLDISVMKSLKSGWDVHLDKRQKHNADEKLSKKDFSKILSSLWKNLDPKVIQSGFMKAGIYPFNDQAILESAFDSAENQ